MISGSLASPEVGYKVNGLWPPPVATGTYRNSRICDFPCGASKTLPLAIFVLLVCFLPLSSPKVIKTGMRNLEGGTHRQHSTLELQGSAKRQIVQEFQDGRRQVH